VVCWCIKYLSRHCKIWHSSAMQCLSRRTRPLIDQSSTREEWTCRHCGVAAPESAPMWVLWRFSIILRLIPQAWHLTLFVSENKCVGENTSKIIAECYVGIQGWSELPVHTQVVQLMYNAFGPTVVIQSIYAPNFTPALYHRTKSNITTIVSCFAHQLHNLSVYGA
jgi:hypothetical protein